MDAGDAVARLVREEGTRVLATLVRVTGSIDLAEDVVQDAAMRAVDAQVALALRTLGGLSTVEVARGLMVSEASMAKRLTRAKQKIAQAAIPYRVPSAAELPGRLTGVAATVYLIFNEGYAPGAGGD